MNTASSMSRIKDIMSPDNTLKKTEPYLPSNIWSLLPPHEELMQGCRVFLTSCLQVGFIPKALFLEQIENDNDSVNVFLLLSILSISARFTPDLCHRFGGSKAACEFFMELAQAMVADEMWNISLTNAQAFFLLGMVDWGRGARERSAVCMGIAVRMVGVLRLHREETYILPPTAHADEIVNSESARRTFWIVHNHDNLYTQQHLPVSFRKSDITTLLPCEENDFAFGRIPAVRAALPGTIPALKDPSLVNHSCRSIFATLIQSHDMWGFIARDIYSAENESSADEPWKLDSSYQRMTKTLRDWEANLPNQHRWSPWNLRGFKAEHVDLAYLSIVTITRLSNIVLRRRYLENISARVFDPASQHDSAPRDFWESMSLELFTNVRDLSDRIDVWFAFRSADDGYPAILALCIYTCGSLASYLYRWPRLCLGLSAGAEDILRRSTEILSTFEDKWATVSEWISNLQKVAEMPPNGLPQQLSDVSTQEAFLNNTTQVGHSPESARSPMTTSSQVMSRRAEGRGSFASTTAPTPEMRPRPVASQEALRAQYDNHPTPSTAPVAQASNLQLLSDAAAYGTYMYAQQNNDPNQRAVHPQGHPHVSQMPYEQMPSRGPGDHTHMKAPPLPPQPPQGPGFPPDATAAAFPLENDFNDMVQGYAHYAWAGWPQ
ncbi:hypothetical protein F4778DRAFT_744178 [Xylariomycetidae sp. FL2044]|nr:hypothetical protein F4778DRAFT_744178 [Xylariomycetidae sp. FL2044]